MSAAPVAEMWVSPRTAELTMAFTFEESMRGVGIAYVLFQPIGALILSSTSTWNASLGDLILGSVFYWLIGGVLVSLIVAVLGVPLAYLLGRMLRGIRHDWMHILAFFGYGLAVGLCGRVRVLDRRGSARHASAGMVALSRVRLGERARGQYRMGGIRGMSATIAATGTSTAPRTRPSIYDGWAVRDLFDRMSGSYERVNLVLSIGFSALWRRQLVRLVPAQPAGARILDAMCGMGETWTTLSRRFPRARLSALDFSGRMVRRARRRSAARFDGRIAVLQCDMLDNGMLDGSLDVVVSAYGVKTFDEVQTELFVDELARILRPGGRFALIDVTEPTNPLLRTLYGFYIAVMVPAFARLLVADTEEYRMLSRYMRGYGDGERTRAALARHPLLVTETRRHFFGCATSFSGFRRADGARH